MCEFKKIIFEFDNTNFSINTELNSIKNWNQYIPIWNQNWYNILKYKKKTEFIECNILNLSNIDGFSQLVVEVWLEDVNNYIHT